LPNARRTFSRAGFHSPKAFFRIHPPPVISSISA
jgi:hypothetical protein